MKALLKFELGNYFKRPGFYVLMFLLVIFGAIIGSKFLLSIGPDIFKNSPYTVAYMTGFLSLFCIFFSTLLATQILFKEKDSNFSLILYATPLRRTDYLSSRFFAVTLLSLICFVLLMLGFASGQQSVTDRSAYTTFRLFNYLQPLLVFGFVNTVFCCAILCAVAWFAKNKLMVYVTGLFIYILYMVMLIFSGSPIMAQGMPQSEDVIKVSASLDPFGLSGYFLQTGNWSVLQRNTELIVPSGIFLLNRVGVLLLSVISLLLAFRKFSFSTNEKGKDKKKIRLLGQVNEHNDIPFKIVQPSFGWQNNWASLISFTRLDIKYITRSIPFLLTCIGVLFYLSMEMYGYIEKGIRLPQKYASSGLMATAIIDSLPGLCLIIVVYYAHEIFWRSRNSNFHLIENSTPAGSRSLFFSKWLTLSIVSIFFTTLAILLGIIFQLAYGYPYVNWPAYGGVYLFVSLPLMLSAAIILIVQKLLNYKYVGLIASSAVVLLTATSIGKQLIRNPLMRFQIPYNGLYSDMNGFGSYAGAYAWKILFGACVVTVGCILITQVKRFSIRPWALLFILLLLLVAFFAGREVLKGYQPKDNEMVLLANVEYEKKYRHFQNEAQPTVVYISTSIDLFPARNAYDVKATYILKNKTNQPIQNILINFADNIQINKASFECRGETVNLKEQYSIISLKKVLQPGDSAQFKCEFSYHWAASNGHESFNAIMQNGSFMRISRYYPVIGYQSDNEIQGERDRKKFNLGDATMLKSIDSSNTSIDDFINLKMIISTSSDQTAIGVGDLEKKWKENNRNYFQYKVPSPVPFRFAVSSANYAIETATHKGRNIEVYYHPTHPENVAHLIKNIKLTIDYCEANFGAYPFKTIRFAEVSAFTRGFAATAYPATIFMTENTVFNANINSDNNQDVINELAGHELSHIWWGNSQISPDDREGSAMLTETLAMYTELMLVKRMHRKKRVMENVNMHLGIYLNERGLGDEQALYKVQPGNIHLMYSKGLVAMYQLTELIGEENVNLALRNLLKKHSYPNQKPISTDFLNELYTVTDSAQHSTIDDLFKKITLYDFKVKNTHVKNVGNKYELTLNAIADKFYEDGMGNKTKALYSDSVHVAIYFKDAKEKVYRMPIINNKVSAKILLDEKPLAIEFDPDIRFIKMESGKQVIKQN